MINISKKEKCCGCSACFNVCPQKCIEMKYDEEGFLYPNVDMTKCINCRLCEKVCPYLFLNNKRNYSMLEFFACKNINKRIRLNSSSGGIFSVIADHIISNYGIVFGAAFNKNMELIHMSVNNKNKLQKLRGSKYLQSYIGCSYSKVKKYLNDNKIVLFCGTPCQIAGLRGYLQQKYTNLYLVDFVCHGVPSPLVFKKYIYYMSNINQSRIIDVSFRDKRYGWDKLTMVLRFENENEEVISAQDSSYFKGFLSNLYLRPSCHDCQFNNFRSGSDLTIGDFWGIKELHSDFYDEQGVSLVIVKTKKGKYLLEKIYNNVTIIKSNFDNVIKHNLNIRYSSKPHKNRECFFKDFKNYPNLIEKNINRNIMNYKWSNDNLKIGIFGSYNSRAVLQKLFLYSDNEICWHFSNSSLISLMSSPMSIEKNNLKVANDFRKNALYYDITKYFINNIDFLSNKVDYLLIDLLEERFDIVKYYNSYLTKSETFRESILNNNYFVKINSIKRTDNMINELWQKACLEFINCLKKYFKSDQIILNKIYLTENIGGYTERKKLFSNVDYIKKINAILAYYYKFFEQAFKGINIISLSDDKLNFCDEQHIYGCAPFHMNDKAYFDLSDQIYMIIKNRSIVKKALVKNNN